MEKKDYEKSLAYCEKCGNKIYFKFKSKLENEKISIKNNLNDIINNKLLQAKAIIGLYKANSVGDDIELYDNGKIMHKYSDGKLLGKFFIII